VRFKFSILIDAFITVLDANGSLSYSTLLGGNSVDEGLGVALDTSGAIYVTGFSNQTSGTAFPVTSGAFQGIHKGFHDAFVAKFQPLASLGGGQNDLVYSTLIGASGSDEGRGIAVDGQGNAYVTGATNSVDFPSAGNAIQGPGNAFIVKLNPTGDALLYSRYLGGSDDSEYDPVNGTQGPDTDEGNAIALDSGGNAYVTGMTASTDFPTVNPYQSALKGKTDAFIAKVDGNGILQYSTYLGGGTHIDGTPEKGEGIAVDGDGNIYVTGITTSGDFPVANATYLQATFGGKADAFIAKLDSAGTTLAYSTFYGAGGVEEGNGIALDGKGNVDIAGSTTSTGGISSSSAVFQSSYGGGVRDAFVARISPIADLWLDMTDNEPVTVGSAGNLT